VSKIALLPLYAIIIAVPVVMAPMDGLLYNPRETPRALALAAGSLVMLACALWAMGRRRAITFTATVLDLAVGLFALAAILTRLTSAVPNLSLATPLWGDDSPQILPCAIALYVGVRAWVRTPEQIVNVHRLLLVAGALVAALGLLDYLWPIPFHAAYSGRRLLGTLGNPMFAGVYYAVLIPLAISRVFAAPLLKERLITAAGGLLMTVALMLTLSRGAWLGLLAGGGLVLALLAWWAPSLLRAVPRVACRGAVVLLLLVGAGLLLHPGARERLSQLARTGLSDYTVQTRLLAIRGALSMFAARPLTGWGPGTTTAVFPQYRPPAALLDAEFGYWTSLPHNLPVQVAAEMGLAGLLPFALLLAAIFIVSRRLLRAPGTRQWATAGLFGGIVVYLAANLSAFDNAATLSVGWILLALLASQAAGEAEFPGMRTFRIQAPPAWLPRVFGVGLLIYALILTGTQFATAVLMERGHERLEEAADVRRNEPTRAARLARAGLADLERVLNLSAPDAAITYVALTNGSLLLASFATDDAAMWESYRRMVAYGEQGLRLNPRDPDLLRQLAVTYLEYGETQQAQRVIRQGLRYEPFNANFAHYYAQWLANEDRLLEAEQYAERGVRLDPLLANGWVLLAHYRYQLTLSGDARGEVLLPEARDHYAKALELGADLSPGYRLEYATLLLLLGDTDQLITQGQLLRGASEREQLRASITTVYRMLGKPGEGAELVRHILQPES